MRSCLIVLSLLMVLTLVFAQTDEETRNAINNIFTSTPQTNKDGEFLPGYEEVTRKGDGSFGALEKCGEGSDQGVHICVPYFQCDGVTKMVVQTGVTDGFGVIDVRFGENACPHYLDNCCGVPHGQTFNNFTAEPKEPGVVEPVPTQQPIPSSTDRLPTTTEKTVDYFRSCGMRNPNGIDFQITGDTANEAQYGEFPWMVAVLRKNSNPTSQEPRFECGASLIAPNIVLTAAHCVYKYKTADIKIRAGEWDTQTTKERLPYQERDVSNIIVHPQFNPQTVIYDIALLILQSNVDGAENVGTVCLPDQDQVINSRNCFATGWGKDVFGKLGSYQVILKKIELPIVQREPCQTALRTTRLGQFFKLHESFICAGGEAGKDTCTGDGGSPLVCPDPNNPNRYVQAGIVSWGIGCGESNIPGVYADVARLRRWVNEKLQELRLTLL